MYTPLNNHGRYQSFIDDEHEPVVIHIIKTGFRDKYIVVTEDALDQYTGEVYVGTQEMVEMKYGVKLIESIVEPENGSLEELIKKLLNECRVVKTSFNKLDVHFYWLRIRDAFDAANDDKFSRGDIERLQSEVYAITGKGEVMMAFNKLLGNNTA